MKRTKVADAGKSWPRLRIYEPPRPTARDRIIETLGKLQSDAPVDEWARKDAAYYLRLLLQKPKLLDALVAQPGAPRRSNAFGLALDYAVRRELLGKAASACEAVAAAWGVKEKTVMHAWRLHRTGAEWKLNDLIGARKEPRHSLLEWVRDDLQDRRPRRPRARRRLTPNK